MTPRTVSTSGAFVTFFKSLFGSGLLALPYALSPLTLKAAVPTYLLLTLACVASCHLLLLSKNISLPAPQTTTYSNLVTHLTTPTLGTATLLLIVSLELCFCSGFVIVILANLTSLLPYSRLAISFFLTPPLVFLGQIDHISKLTIPSLLAIIVYVPGVIGVTSYASLTSGTFPYPSSSQDIQWSYLPSFFGTVTYALEGVCLVLPVESSMSRPGDCYALVSASIALYSAASISYSGLAYLASLSGCEVITTCLPGETGSVVKVALSVAMVGGHCVTLYPAVEMVEGLLWPNEGRQGEEEMLLPGGRGEFEKGRKGKGWKGKVLRFLAVMVTIAVGYSVPSFSGFSDVVGSLGLSTVGFVIPPVLYFKACKDAKVKIGWKEGVMCLGCGAVGGFNICVEVIKLVGGAVGRRFE